MFTPKGTFGWYELMTPDVLASEKFYTSVVGWNTSQVGSPEMPYTTFNVGTYGVAGMLTVPGRTAWIGYISVEDVDAHIPKIIEAGGKLWKPATDVPGMLRFAVLSDPQGAPFVVFTSNPTMQSPADPPKPPAYGTIGWHELYAADLEPAWEFYQNLFGFTKLTDMDMGPMGTYRLFNDAGNSSPMGIGGMMTKAPDVPNASWGFYFHVDSIKAAIQRLTEAGGKVLLGPHQVPGDAWIVMAVDPHGAHFNLVSPTE
jgi:predicted enzyme related to lactoylglutathione lyase